MHVPMRKQLTSEASPRNRSSAKRSYAYLDSDELAKRYGGKPENLKHVRARVATKYGGMRRTLLYKIPMCQNDEDESASSASLDAAHLIH